MLICDCAAQKRKGNLIPFLCSLLLIDCMVHFLKVIFEANFLISCALVSIFTASTLFP
jgi:hypothetical protein